MADIFMEDWQQVFRVNLAFLMVDQAWTNLAIFEHLNQRLQHGICNFCVQWDTHERVQDIYLSDICQILLCELDFMLVNFPQK